MMMIYTFFILAFVWVCGSTCSSFCIFGHLKTPSISWILHYFFLKIAVVTLIFLLLAASFSFLKQLYLYVTFVAM